MRRKLCWMAVLSALLVLNACGGRSLEGKWEVSVKTPFFEGRVLTTTLTLKEGRVYDSDDSMIGSYSMEGDKVSALDFDLRAGGITGVSLRDGSFTDGDRIEGERVLLKRSAFGDTLNGIWWKARRLE